MLNEYVIVRGRDSGVHVGTLLEQHGREVLLADASIVWRWRGANTLYEMSLRGVDTEYSRISEQVARAFVPDAIMILPCTEVAHRNLSKPRWPA